MDDLNSIPDESRSPLAWKQMPFWIPVWKFGCAPKTDSVKPTIDGQMAMSFWKMRAAVFLTNPAYPRKCKVLKVVRIDLVWKGCIEQILLEGAAYVQACKKSHDLFEIQLCFALQKYGLGHMQHLHLLEPSSKPLWTGLVKLVKKMMAQLKLKSPHLSTSMNGTRMKQEAIGTRLMPHKDHRNSQSTKCFLPDPLLDFFLIVRSFSWLRQSYQNRRQWK